MTELQEASSMMDEAESPHAARVISQFARFMQDEASALMKYPEMTLQQAANYPEGMEPTIKAQVNIRIGDRNCIIVVSTCY